MWWAQVLTGGFVLWCWEGNPESSTLKSILPLSHAPASGGESCLILSHRCWARHVRRDRVGWFTGEQFREGSWGFRGLGRSRVWLSSNRSWRSGLWRGVWAVERTSQNCVWPGLLLLKSSEWLTSLRAFWSQSEVSHTCLFSWMSEWVCLNIDVTDQVCSLLCDTRRGPRSYSGQKLEVSQVTVFITWDKLMCTSWFCWEYEGCLDTQSSVELSSSLPSFSYLFIQLALNALPFSQVMIINEIYNCRSGQDFSKVQLIEGIAYYQFLLPCEYWLTQRFLSRE